MVAWRGSTHARTRPPKVEIDGTLHIQADSDAQVEWLWEYLSNLSSLAAFS